ncbi:MAG: MOSC domain-containing protein [Streptosporangiales bacterium]
MGREHVDGSPVARITRLGLTPVKGMEHVSLPSVDLTADGPRHDRVFCLVDPGTGAVLRTVSNDALLACRASLDPPVLTMRTPLGEASGVVVDGPAMTGDYWGSEVRLVTVAGPWSELLSSYLGRSVVLCRSVDPGAIVWGGSVSIVTTSSLDDLSRRLGRPADDGARFRATVVVDTGQAPPFVEDDWVGKRVRLGTATVTVRGPLPRCAVVERRPGAGGQDARVLAALTPDRHHAGEIRFGVHADVEEPGTVAFGEPVVAPA